MLMEHTPIDYLDFASPVAGLGSKMGLDATNKWPGETHREWGRPIVMEAAVRERATACATRWGCSRHPRAGGNPVRPISAASERRTT